MKRKKTKLFIRQRRHKKRIEKMQRKVRRKQQKRKDKKHYSLRKHGTVLAAPIIFDIHDKKRRSLLLEFIKNMRRQFTDPGVWKITINFKQTRKFIATGTLLFYAELCHLMRTTPRQIVLRCFPPRNDLAGQVLEQIGVYRMLGHRHTGELGHREVVHWKVASANEIDATQYAHAIEAHAGSLAKPLVDGVFKGLAEAMSNVIEHAYPEKHVGARGWWVFSQAREGKLSVVMCDIGVGIPKTLPMTSPSLFERIKTVFGVSPPDSRCIEEAVKESKSRTGRQERGKGLGNIVASAGDRGSILIYSNRGCYLAKSGMIETADYRGSISGTLVCWQLPLVEESKR